MKKPFPLSAKTTAALALAFFWVLTHWGYWDKGVLALGWNASVFWLGLLVVLFMQSKERNFRKMSSWLIPLILMSSSFALFENPWLKSISMWVLPLSIVIFYVYGQMEVTKKTWWGSMFAWKILDHFFAIFTHVQKSVSQIITESLFLRKDEHKQRFKSIVIGLGLLTLLLLVVVLPLLKSADTEFAGFMGVLFDVVMKFFDSSLIGKIAVFIFISVGLLAVFLAWTPPLQGPKEPVKKQLDNWVAGILLGGLLIFYFMFLYFQVDKVAVGNLPLDLSTTVNLVKAGFWQLFFLSMLNGFLFMYFYHRTHPFPQLILKAFILASGLILVSAAWRMGLYVTLYGFSYEKFFASYTTLFGLILFVILIGSSFKRDSVNILKVLSFMALWFYSIATVLPIESIILNSNRALSERSDSRIIMYELTMLSSDVYETIEANYLKWDKSDDAQIRWKAWLKERDKEMKDRSWFETNLSLL